MKHYDDLVKEKDKISELHWSNTEAFTREEVWSLLDLIARQDERIQLLQREIEIHEENQRGTLQGALRAMREKK